VTPAQVQSFARDVLDPSRASVIVAGDGKTMLPTLTTSVPGITVVPIAQFDPDSPTLKNGS